MTDYEIIVFYREDPAELVSVAEGFAAFYRLRLRYEQIPDLPVAITAFFNENTIMCIFQRQGCAFRRLMKYVYALKRPALIVCGEKSGVAFRSLKVPVGYLPENKEKVMWVNFFRHYNPECQVELVVPHEKDEGIARQVANNVGFFRQVFQKSGVSYNKTSTETGFENTLRQIFQQTDDATVLLMRPFRLFSFQIPLALQLFRKYGRTPALIIPRDDALYIPCH